MMYIKYIDPTQPKLEVKAKAVLMGIGNWCQPSHQPTSFWTTSGATRKLIFDMDLAFNRTTGSITRTALFNMRITPFKMSLYKEKLDAKFH